MKTYSVLFAEDVPHYGSVEIQAENDAAALEAAKAYDFSGIATDRSLRESVCKRIVNIEDAAGNEIAVDVALDDWFLRGGGEQVRLLCDAASALLAAFETLMEDINEAFPGGFRTEEESTMFDANLQKARAALAKARGRVA